MNERELHAMLTAAAQGKIKRCDVEDQRGQRIVVLAFPWRMAGQVIPAVEAIAREVTESRIWTPQPGPR